MRFVTLVLLCQFLCSTNENRLLIRFPESICLRILILDIKIQKENPNSEEEAIDKEIQQLRNLLAEKERKKQEADAKRRRGICQK